METYDILGRLQATHWDWTESLQASRVQDEERAYHIRTRYSDEELLAAFGSQEPRANQLLLHYAGDPFPAALTPPVLLLPGATKAGSYFWDPDEDGSQSGLAQRLRRRGCRVYALTYSHNQDCNFRWAGLIEAAIDRIRVLHDEPQVDLVAHSNSGIAARILTSRLHPNWDHQVRRLALVGSPNGGLDYFFRYPQINFNLIRDDDNPLLNWPMTWDEVLMAGEFVDWSEFGYGSSAPDYWPGQRQMLARWDQRYALPSEGPDVRSTYYGGIGEVSKAQGLMHFLEDGGNLIGRLQEEPGQVGVEFGLLAGCSPTLRLGKNDLSGPGDGIVFVESATMMPEESPVTSLGILPLNHADLIGDPLGQEWICQFLLGSSRPVLSGSERRGLVSRSLG